MMDAIHSAAWLLATDTPALPSAGVMRLGLTVGWALVLALLGAGLGFRLAAGARRLLALALALWTLVPGPASPDYWLGLAFHAPSLSAMLLCAWGLQRLLFAPPHQAGTAPVPSAPLWLLALGVLPGYALMLDTFAALPLQIYAWGFSPLALLCLLAVSLLPGLRRRLPLAWGVPEVWVAPAALLLFAATRLPTGNVWDALTDPWLWLFLNGVLLRALFRRWRGARLREPQV